MNPTKQTEHKALKDLTKTIDEANRIRQEIDALKAKQHKLEAVHMSYEHPHFPFYKATVQLEADAKKKTPLRIFVIVSIASMISFLVAVGFYMFYGAITTRLTVGETLTQILYYTGIVLSLVLLVVFMIKLTPVIYRHAMDMIRKRMIIKRQEDLTIAQAESMNMCEEYQTQLNEKLKAIKNDMNELKKNLSGHERVIRDSNLISEEYYGIVHDLLAYFESNRADFVKEALNLYENEKKTHFYFTRLLEGIRNQTIPIQDVFDESIDVKTYEEKTQKPEKVETDIETPKDTISEVYLLSAQSNEKTSKESNKATDKKEAKKTQKAEKKALKEAKKEEKTMKKLDVSTSETSKEASDENA